MSVKMDKEGLFSFTFGCSSSTITRKVIITPFMSLKRFTEDGEVLESFKGRVYSGKKLKSARGEYTLIYSGIGDRLLGDAVLLLGTVTPAEEILFAGTCGGMNECQIGDIVLCERAFNGEGFSAYYKKDFSMRDIFDRGELISADGKYISVLKDFFDEKITDERPFRSGDIFTIGSLAAESKETLLNIQGKGYLGVDMELSAVYKAAAASGLKSAGVLVVSDLPIEKPFWESLTSFEEDEYNSGVEDMVDVLKDFVEE